MSSSQTSAHRRSKALPAYVGLVIAVGFAIIGHSLYRLPDTPDPFGWMALGALAVIAASFALKVPGMPVYLSISDTFFITSALLFGPAPATVTIALDSLVISWRRGNNLQQLLFNSTSSAIALWCGVQTYYALSPSGPLAGIAGSPDAMTILPLAGLAAVYFVLNSGCTAVAVSLSKGVSAAHLFRQHFAVISLNYFAAASASFFLIVLGRYIGWTAIAAVMPLILICYLAMRSWLGRVDDAERHLAKINQLYLSTIGALSTAIEAKDGVTSDHIHRVQAYAMGLARALPISDPLTLQAIEAAALLHDTGKLAVPEHILNKPGKLTFDEFETMKLHVDVGADILSSIDFPYPVVPIVRAHHENWDGSGYPSGLTGEDIPIGARILSVVDCFDALTSDRPYRGAMTEAQALDIIVERRGTMYDPAVVDTFLRVHRDIAPKAMAQPVLMNAVRRIRRAHAAPSVGMSIPSPADTELPLADASEELLAFVSLARVATRTPALSDIGALAWGHLRNLAPGASLALFTVDAAQTALVARYTAGPAASRLTEMTIGLGERVSGWAAANLRVMANADAALDLTSDLAGDLCFALAVPLIADGVLVGVMTLYAPELFADDRRRGLEMIAPHLATSVASAVTDAARSASAVTESSRSRSARKELRVVARR